MFRPEPQAPRFAAFLLVLSLLCLSAAAAAQDSAPRKYALLIGIDNYIGGGIEGISPLKYAVKDAESLEDVLESRGWDAVAVVKEDATRRRIIRELYQLALKTRPLDRVLIYFAGHGVRDPFSRDHTYWLTYESSLASLAADGIRLNHILEYVMDIPAQEKIVILDHCYGGDIVRAQTGPGDARDGPVGEPSVAEPRDLFPSDFNTIEQQTQDRLVILGAARGPAYEHDDWGHGMFTKAILDVLEDPSADQSDPRDGKISLNEFWSQVSQKVSQMASDKNLEQRPFGSKISVEQLSWVLFDAAVDAGTEADELRWALTQLDLAASLDFQVKLACQDVINLWQSREQQRLNQDPKYLQVIRELRFIRDTGPSNQAEAKKQSLEDKVRALGLVGGSP